MVVNTDAVVVAVVVDNAIVDNAVIDSNTNLDSPPEVQVHLEPEVDEDADLDINVCSMLK